MPPHHPTVPHTNTPDPHKTYTQKVAAVMALWIPSAAADAADAAQAPHLLDRPAVYAPAPSVSSSFSGAYPPSTTASSPSFASSPSYPVSTTTASTTTSASSHPLAARTPTPTPPASPRFNTLHAGHTPPHRSPCGSPVQKRVRWSRAAITIPAPRAFPSALPCLVCEELGFTCRFCARYGEGSGELEGYYHVQWEVEIAGLAR